MGGHPALRQRYSWRCGRDATMMKKCGSVFEHIEESLQGLFDDIDVEVHYRLTVYAYA